MLNKLAPQFLPPHFVADEFETSFTLNQTQVQVFHFFCNTKTFTNLQIPPYRVEFVSCHPDKKNVFETGVQTIHHGPLMNFAGVIGEIRSPYYRDLQYYYGSYAISLYLARPVRLEIWFDKISDKKTKVKIKVTWHIRKSFRWFWRLFQKIFFLQFAGNIKICNFFGLVR